MLLQFFEHSFSYFAHFTKCSLMIFTVLQPLEISFPFFFGTYAMFYVACLSQSLLLLVSLGGSGWSDFELLDRLDRSRVPYSWISIASLLMHTPQCRYIQLPNKRAQILVYLKVDNPEVPLNSQTLLTPACM